MKGRPDGAVLPAAFVEACRGAGLNVGLQSALLYSDALGEVGLYERSGVYWAGRATLVHRPEDVECYDEVFAVFWEQCPGSRGAARGVARPVVQAFDDDNADGGALEPPGSDGDEPALAVRYSALEVLRQKDFVDYTEAELAEARRLMASLQLVSSRRPARRYEPSRRGRHDLRRTVRRALRSGGEPMRREWKARRQKPRRLILICDVSGSMEAYSRALLRFVHAAVVGRTRVEAFALGTRLTRLTRQLTTKDPDAALRELAATVPDFAGGTRIGDGLRAFNDTWGIRGMARGSIVVILSDGWDRGDPAVLGEEMGRLRRVARRIVWVNPLKASPGYQPLAAGMAAALPYVDDFVEGHTLASLDELAAVIAA